MLSPDPKPPPHDGQGRRTGISRVFEVGAVLARYGFGGFLHQSGLGEWVRGRRKRDEGAGLPAHVAFRRALEELGPTAVKFGQALSTRADVLPPEWVAELRQLQDRVAPITFDDVRAVVEEEFGQPLAQLFASFQHEPVASASIAQVHFAVLNTGEQVAVKVQRPGIRRVIDRDLSLLTQAARIAEAHIQWCSEHSVASLVGEFARNLRGELNFDLEARNTKLLGANLAEDPRASTPRVYDRLSGARVLTAERVTGHKPSDAEALDAAGVDRPTAARNLATIVVKQILRDGCFHADPHGGNVLIAPGGRIFFLDCGNVAFVPPHIRDALVHMLFALMEGDADEVAVHITTIGLATSDTDMTALRADISRQVVGFHSLSTSDVTIGETLEEMLHLIFRHHIRVPPVFAQIIRTLVLTDAECRTLDSRFDFREAVRTVVLDILRRVTRPREAALEAYRVLRQVHQYAMLLPRQLSGLIRRADAGELKVQIEPGELERPMHRLDVMFNRLAFSIVIAAMILAPALWMQVDVERAWPLWHPANVLLVIGFALGLWLLYSIIRSGRL